VNKTILVSPEESARLDGWKIQPEPIRVVLAGNRRRPFSIKWNGASFVASNWEGIYSQDEIYRKMQAMYLAHAKAVVEGMKRMEGNRGDV
jgi:hypothetical protein